MKLRSASLLAIVCLTLALLARFAAFAPQVDFVFNMNANRMPMQYFLAMCGGMLSELLEYGALLVFFFAVRRSVGPDA